MEIRGRKVLVTGGAGFIGSHLVESLLRLGCEVVVYDNFDDFYPGKEGNLKEVEGHRRFRLVRGTILETGPLRTAMAGADLVFHLAGQAGIRYCMANPQKAHMVNVTGTLNVLSLARELRVQKVVFASSSSLYGDSPKVPIAENQPLNPTSVYGATKLAAEKYCMAYGVSYSLPVTCLRYFSVYGPRGRPDQVLYSMAVKAAFGRPLEIFGDGKQSRDFTFISDIVSGTVMAALRDDSVGQVFNLGYGEEFSIAEAGTRIDEYFRNVVKPVHLSPYKSDFPRTLCDNRKARSVLGWKPQVSFESGLDQFLEWFSKVRMPDLERR